MSRVSENSTSASIKFNMNRTRKKLEDLQTKGSTLKNISKPSDNPLNAIEALSIGSKDTNNIQFIRNINHAELRLKTADKALEELTEIVQRAKEITIGQSSDLYGAKIRKNIASEIIQLRNQALAIGNRRIGSKYIFGGFQSLKPPFDSKGNYGGDAGKVHMEIQNDFFVPINITGAEVFFYREGSSNKLDHPLSSFADVFKKSLNTKEKRPEQEDDIIGNNQTDFYKERNIIGQLDLLIRGLENNDSAIIQSLLERFDESRERLVSIRTQVGSIFNSVLHAKDSIVQQKIDNAEIKSKFIDADVAELFSELAKQQQALKNSYKTSTATLSKNLIDFLK